MKRPPDFPHPPFLWRVSHHRHQHKGPVVPRLTSGDVYIPGLFVLQTEHLTPFQRNVFFRREHLGTARTSGTSRTSCSSPVPIFYSSRPGWPPLGVAPTRGPCTPGLRGHHPDPCLSHCQVQHRRQVHISLNPNRLTRDTGCLKNGRGWGEREIGGGHIEFSIFLPLLGCGERRRSEGRGEKKEET